MFALCHRTVCIYIYILSYQLSQILINTTDLLTMDWQLPDIGKTITNNILPSSLSAYAVRILCRLAVFGYFRIVSRYYHGYALVCIVGKK